MIKLKDILRVNISFFKKYIHLYKIKYSFHMSANTDVMFSLEVDQSCIYIYNKFIYSDPE